MSENYNIVATTRVRLARNLRGYNFPHKFKSTAESDEIIKKVVNAVTRGTDMTFERISSLSPTEKRRFVERHIISPELASSSYGAFIHTPDNKISIMINEEDHIRIQAVCDGFNIDKALLAANEVESMLAEELMLAYDDELGYLTACPSNLGTGLRISAMLHLPALTKANAIGDLISSLSKMGFTVRGVYGEGSKAVGSFYQISNEVTLGSTKREIAESFKKIIDAVCTNEKSASKQILAYGGIDLEDKLMRSLGILKTCRKISSDEAITRLSDIIFGITEGIIRMDINEVYSSFWEIMPACIGGDADALNRDILRANYLNNLFKEV